MPDQNLKVALIPLDTAEADVKANLNAVSRRLASLDSDTGLVVLPEMFSTGFVTDPDTLARIAETDCGTTMMTLRQWAKDRSIHIWGTFIAADNDRYFNRGFMVSPEGETTFYNKRHLFRYGGESELFTPGCKPAPIVSVNSWNFKMSICYDLRFPTWNRSVANNYDVLVVPANWPHKRYFAWKHLLIARAIENQAYVLGCNREGTDLYGKYERGESLILDNWGTDVAERRDDGTVYATLDATRFNEARRKFEPWRDADGFELTI